MNVLNISEAVILIRWQLEVSLPSQNFTCFLTRGYVRAYHELLQGQGYANESLAHS